MAEQTIKLDWVAELVKQFPVIPNSRKSIFSITGFHDDELVNSNLLSFYFHSEEEHQFKGLFLQSMLDILEEKAIGNVRFNRQDFDITSSLVIRREVFTESGKRIDILIESVNEIAETPRDSEAEGQWAIIIENKLETRPLDKVPNLLEDYWQSVRATKKIGVALTLYEVVDKRNLLGAKHEFYNVLHKELMAQVRKNLPEYFEGADDRHLMILKEYMANIAQFYNDRFQQSIPMQDTLKLFHAQKENIWIFKQMDTEMLRFVSNALFQVMRKWGFEPHTPDDKSVVKHFYHSGDYYKNKEYNPDGLRFWVWMDGLRYHNTFDAVFELYGKENTRFGDELKAFLEAEKAFVPSLIKPGEKGYAGGNFHQLLVFKIPVPNYDGQHPFELQLEKALKETLFEHPKNYIENLSRKLAILKSGKSNLE